MFIDTPLSRLAAFVLAFAGMLANGQVTAESVADFYRGKTVHTYVGFGPGGNNDTWARTLARHLPKHLPGEPVMVVQNMPGAGSLKLTNFLYNAAPKDGTAFGIVSRGIPLDPLFGGKQTQFDPLKFGWIGSPTQNTTVCVARKDAAVQNMEDLLTKQLTVGASGSGADTNTYPTILNNLLGMKFKVITGYKGSKDIYLAIERNEVEGVCIAFSSLARRAIYKDGLVKVLFQAANEGDPKLKGIPLVIDLVKSDADKQALNLFFARAVMGRPFLAPPDVPQERIKALQEAFDKTMKDPAFLADAKKVKLRVDPVSGEQLSQTLAKAYQTPAEIVTRVSKAIGR